MTIEERARAYHDRIIKQNEQAEAWDFYNAYIAGATEQEKIDEEEQGKALLYAVHKTAERTKKDMIDKAWEWITIWAFENAPHEVYDDLMSYACDFKKAMEE